MKSKRPQWLLAFLAIAGTAVSVGGCGGGVGGASASGTATVRFGSVGGLTDAGVYLADALGYFKKNNIKVVTSRMQGGSALTSAVATGNLDAAGISVSAGLFNAVNRGIKLKIVGDKQSIRPNFSATHLVAQKKYAGASEAETLAHLKGKTIAVSDKTSGTTGTLDSVLQKYGMSVRDFNLKEMGYAEITTALLNGSVDAGVELEPFLTKSLSSGRIADVSDQTEALPKNGATVVPLVYSDSFINEKRDVAQRFMDAYMQGVRAYNDAFQKGKDKDRVVSIIAKQSGTDEQTVQKANRGGLDPNQQVNVQFLGSLEDWFMKQGYVTKRVEPAQIVDSSFAANSVKKLGEYKETS